jgi:glucose/arabinose dehydrogenase
MKRLLLSTLLFLFLLISVKAQFADPGFYEQEIGTWNFPISFVFDQGNKMYMAEKGGKVYKYENYTKTLLLDITEEVSVFNDEGIYGIAIHPDFAQNGYMYLYYIVDRHHLFYYGTSSYSPNQNEQGPTIARLTRYTVNVNNGFNSIVPNSRFILVGEDRFSGFPQVGSHAGGDIKFGSDGSIIVSCGDGSLDGPPYEQQAFSEGLINQDEYNAGLWWRCQINNSLDGKLVRLDPLTGNGLPSNPYYNPANPRSPESRIFVKGLRNPFRFNMKPGSGSTNPNDGDPGIIYINDVGQEVKEEINIATSAGQNFGWPAFEGMDVTVNVGFIPPSPNPILIPSTFEKPRIEWGRTNSTARVLHENSIESLANIEEYSPNFTGGASVAGAFYQGTLYPQKFWGKYFFCDFNDQWCKVATMSEDDDAISIQPFNEHFVGLINLVYNPNDQCFYYCTVTNKLIKVNYNTSINQNPVAKFVVNKNYGLSGLQVIFDAEDSFDPENSALIYNWDFGDGSSATGSNVIHTFNSVNPGPINFDVTLTVSDNLGKLGTVTQVIFINNTPPLIMSTSIDNLEKVLPNSLNPTTFSAVISDAEHATNTLSKKWEVFLYHNQHRHLSHSSTDLTTAINLDKLPCDNLLYFYRVILTVTDPMGLEKVFTKDIYCDCKPLDDLDPSSSILKVDQISNNSLKLSWQPFTDNLGLKFLEVNINGIGVDYLLPSATEYVHRSEYYKLGFSHTAKIIARDSSGNKGSTPRVFFSIINNTSSVDKIAPNFITSLSFNPITKQLSWGAVTDNYDLNLMYEVYLNNSKVYENSNTGFILNSLTQNSNSVHIQAKDDYGNLSSSQQIDFVMCPDHSILLNQSNYNVSQGTHVHNSKLSLVAQNKIGGPANVVYSANKFIELLPSFEVSRGAVFTTQLIGCSN